MSEIKYVRLKPYDVPSGCVVRRYLYRGKTFVTDGETRRPIWYQINDAKLLKELAALTQHDANPQSPKLFDIMGASEYALAVEEEERRRLVQLGIMTASSPHPSVRTPTVDRTGRGLAVPEEAPQAATAATDEEADEPAGEADDDSGDAEAPAEEPTTPRRRRRGSFATPAEG